VRRAIFHRGSRRVGFKSHEPALLRATMTSITVLRTIFTEGDEPRCDLAASRAGVPCCRKSTPWICFAREKVGVARRVEHDQREPIGDLVETVCDG